MPNDERLEWTHEHIHYPQDVFANESATTGDGINCHLMCGKGFGWSWGLTAHDSAEVLGRPSSSVMRTGFGTSREDAIARLIEALPSTRVVRAMLIESNATLTVTK